MFALIMVNLDVKYKKNNYPKLITKYKKIWIAKTFIIPFVRTKNKKTTIETKVSNHDGWTHSEDERKLELTKILKTKATLPKIKSNHSTNKKNDKKN